MKSMRALHPIKLKRIHHLGWRIGVTFGSNEAELIYYVAQIEREEKERVQETGIGEERMLGGDAADRDA